MVNFCESTTNFYRAAWARIMSVCPSVTRVDYDKTEERSVQV